MYFYSIVTLAILFPLCLKEKKVALRISMLLLFVLLGFQYKLVNDWESNIWRWKVAIGEISLSRGSRDIEPFFLFILRSCKWLSFFGWLMAVAAAFLAILYKIVRKYVPEKYYWISIAVLMWRTDYGLLFINSNRQCVSVILTVLAVMVLVGDIKVPLKLSFVRQSLMKFLFSILLIYAGAQCHSAAYLAFLVIPAFLISLCYKGEKWILMAIAFNTFYLGRMFIDVTALQSYMTIFTDSMHLESVNQYRELLDGFAMNNSFMLMSTDCLIITTSCFFYRTMTKAEKMFCLLWLLGVVLGAYMMENLARMTEYFYYYLLVLLPLLVGYSHSFAIKYKVIIIHYMACLYVLSYYAYYSWRTMHGVLYGRWLDYVSVFDSIVWY